MKTRQEEFLEKLKPFMEKIKPIDIEDKHIDKIYSDYLRYSSRKVKMNIKEFKTKFIQNKTVRCAIILRALEESWAPYDTPETIQEIIKCFHPEAEKEIFRDALYLESIGLIESQGKRFRRIK